MKKIIEKIRNIIQEIFTLLGREFYHDPLMLSILVLTGIFELLFLFILIFNIQPSDAIVPLTYNVVYGVISLGKWYTIYLYFLASLLIVILNILVAWLFFNKERLLSYIIGIINILIIVLTTIYTYNLVALIK